MLRWGQREACQSRGRKEACGPHRGAGGHSGGLAEPWYLQAGGWPWVWEKQREPEGGRWRGGWWWGALSPWVKSPTTTKEEGMSKEQKQTEQKEAGK